MIMVGLLLILLLTLAFQCSFVLSFKFCKMPCYPQFDNHKKSRVVSSRRINTQLNGIPRLFRWLVEKYPSVVHAANTLEVAASPVASGVVHGKVPRFERQMKPQTQSNIDNFYLDMNGIIHACTHANREGLTPLNEKEMFKAIFGYTDSLFKFIRPKNKMFLAVDGVAPRAKRNQQRARRFRSSKDRQTLILDFMERNGRLPTDLEAFDSNCITPGTPFMGRLCYAFQAWINHKIKTDSYWQNSNCTVIFSGSDVPGEGEHKVMNMIRSDQLEFQTNHGNEPRLKHCLYGLDADLIMLSLVSHEPHFILLREKVTNKYRESKLSAKKKNPTTATKVFKSSNFEVLDISMVRAMLAKYFDPARDILSSVGINPDGSVKLGDVMLSLKDGDLRKSRERRKKGKSSRLPSFLHPSWLESIRSNAAEASGWQSIAAFRAGTSPGTSPRSGNNPSSGTVPNPRPSDSKPGQKGLYDFERVVDDFVLLSFLIGNDFIPSLPHVDIADGCMHTMMNIYQQLLPRLGGYITDGSSIHLPRLELVIGELSRREPLYFEQRSVDDLVPEYGTEEYKEYYYLTKFNMNYSDKEGIKHIIQSYVESLFWVAEYYHGGCCSWSWFYPYYYAPLASDLKDLGQYAISLQSGKPATSLLQLISVLPQQSGNLLPPAYEEAMKSPNNPINKYFPIDFEVDQNGKKADWEGVVKIPFIDESELIAEMSKISSSQSPNQLKRQEFINAVGKDHVYKLPGGADEPEP